MPTGRWASCPASSSQEPPRSWRRSSASSACKAARWCRNSNMAELRITDTNSANDSKGRAFGLEGNDFIYVLIAFVAAMALYLVSHVVLLVPAVGALVLALPIFMVPAAWVLLLRHNKPAGYAEDWF